MHPDHFWEDDHLNFRSVCHGWIEPAGHRWKVRVAGSLRPAYVRDKSKGVRWIERWASTQEIRTRYPRVEVPGF